MTKHHLHPQRRPPPRPPSSLYSAFVCSRPTDRSFLHSVLSNRVLDVRRVLRDPRSRLFVDFNAKVGGGGTPLIAVAAAAGHLNVVYLMLMEESVRPGAEDSHGNTALHLAAANGNLDVVKALVSCPRIDVMAQNRRGQTAAELARDALATRDHGQAGYLGLGHCVRYLLSLETSTSTCTSASSSPSPSSSKTNHKHKLIVPPRGGNPISYSPERSAFQSSHVKVLLKGDLREKLMKVKASSSSAMKKMPVSSTIVWNNNNNAVDNTGGQRKVASMVKASLPLPPWAMRNNESFSNVRLAYDDEEEDVKYEVYEVEEDSD